MSSALSSIFPQTRAEVFRLLFAGNAARLHVREIARRSGLTLGAVQEELKKLSGAGLLSKERDGNRLYYAADTEHPFFPDLRSMVLKTAGLADVLREGLSAVEGMRMAFVFGSLAAGTDTAGSDVDLMVIGKVSLRALATPLRRVSLELGREINPNVLAEEEWPRRLKKQDAFILRVADEPKIWLKGGPDELGSLG